MIISFVYSHFHVSNPCIVPVAPCACDRPLPLSGPFPSFPHGPAAPTVTVYAAEAGSRVAVGTPTAAVGCAYGLCTQVFVGCRSWSWCLLRVTDPRRHKVTMTMTTRTTRLKHWSNGLHHGRFDSMMRRGRYFLYPVLVHLKTMTMRRPMRRPRQDPHNPAKTTFSSS